MKTYNNKAERYLLAREIAEEGIVLLKNENCALPIKDEKTAVFGRTQIDTIKCGTGSAFCLSEYTVSVLEGIENAGITVDEILKEKYAAWTAQNSIRTFGVWGSGSHLNPEMPITDEEIREASVRAEKAIVVFGRTAGENDDVIVMEGDFLLSFDEKNLLESVCRHFKQVIIVVNSGNMIDFSFAQREEVKAVVLLNLPGMEGGNALGNILAGKVSPSAKLTDTITRDYGDWPSAEIFGIKSGIVQNYHEDIYVGYRYFETFPYRKDCVLYPFGHGLSYTSFSVKCVHFECGEEKENGEIHAVVSVKNTGDTAGKEVVMLYSSSPESALKTPAKELRAFEKTKLLEPGEEEYLSLSFPIRDMASFDDTGVLGTPDTWMLARGDYEIYLGNNVEQVKAIGVYSHPETTAVKTCTHIDTELSERMLPDGSYEYLDCIPPNLDLGVPVEAMGVNIVSTEEHAVCEGDLSNLREGETVTFRVNVQAMGVYHMHFCAEEPVEYDLFINNVPVPESEVYYEGDELLFPIGPSEIKFRAKKDGKFAITSMSLEKNSKPVPIEGEGYSYVEGGKYNECALWVHNKPFIDPEGAIRHGRCVFRLHTPGRYAMYRLQVKRAGFYDVRLRYHNRHQTVDLRDTLSFMVSNVTQHIEEVTLYHTEKFEYRTSEPFRLALPQGEVFLNVVSTSTMTPHITYFEFTPSTRAVEIEEYVGGAKPEEEVNISDVDDYGRPPVSKTRHTCDFRSVIDGTLSLDAFVNDLTDEELAVLSCGNANGKIGYIPERGIPEARWADGSVGLRLNAETTVYPSGTMLSCTWNPTLAKELGRAIGAEAHEYAVDVWLAPAINIHRNPCCGRNFEYDSEDPFVSGEMASAIINGVQEFNVAATIKHFAANNTEYQRMRSNSRVSARALREIYMRGFERVIQKSNPYSIMTSYNYLNGIKVCEDPIICRDIMRRDFGYTGVLMTDFSNDSDHVKELRAGHDLKMHFGDTRSVVKNLQEGTLSRESVRGSIKRILELLLKTTVKNS